MGKAKLESVLAGVPLFQGLTKRQLRQLAALAKPATYEAGASIVNEGEQGDVFFVVLTGQARVTVRGKAVHQLLPGDHFGEISLLDGEARSASVAAETPMTLLTIGRRGFMRSLERDPPLAMSMMASLARMLRRIDRSLAR